MALSTAQSAILHAGMAGEKIGQAAHAAYWLASYGHEGANYQLKIIRDEYAKLIEAVAAIDAAHLEEAASLATLQPMLSAVSEVA